MKKVIIDTDIGGDIDDALAVALALNSPELDVIGITTVFENTLLRAKLAKKLLQVFNRSDIPVIKGVEKPIINDWDRSLIPPQVRAVREEIEVNENINAVDFIVEKIMNSAEPVTLITIGPLTNIAGAIIKEPGLKDKTRIYMMGGMYSQAFPEWNIYCDPEAGRVVFDSGIPITMVGLDVTLKCKLGKKSLDKIFDFNSERTNFLSELIRIWQEDDESRFPILHDPLAVATLIDPSLVRRESMHIKVETRGEFTRGVTVVTDTPYGDRKGDSNVDVSVDVDSDRFIQFFLERILK
ncbi:MAG TPA: nucleoside hydrolase [bacterium]|nr:nucleoside hydrolase [bacterium]